jgi:hypothetical protein
MVTEIMIGDSSKDVISSLKTSPAISLHRWRLFTSAGVPSMWPPISRIHRSNFTKRIMYRLLVSRERKLDLGKLKGREVAMFMGLATLGPVSQCNRFIMRPVGRSKYTLTILHVTRLFRKRKERRQVRMDGLFGVNKVRRMGRNFDRSEKWMVPLGPRLLNFCALDNRVLIGQTTGQEWPSHGPLSTYRQSRHVAFAILAKHPAGSDGKPRVLLSPRFFQTFLLSVGKAPTASYQPQARRINTHDSLL